MTQAGIGLDPQNEALQKKLSALTEGIDKAFAGTMHAAVNVCLLKEYALMHSGLKNRPADRLYSSLSVLEVYIETLRDDIDALVTLASKEVFCNSYVNYSGKFCFLATISLEVFLTHYMV